MITEHALNRYIERFEGSSNIGELERLRLFKSLTQLFHEAGFLYDGCLRSDKLEKATYYKNGLIIFVVQNKSVVTLWKLSSNFDNEIKRINILKNKVDKLKRVKEWAEENNKATKAIVNYLIENDKPEEIKVMMEINASYIHQCTLIKRELSALKLVMETELHNIVYSNVIDRDLEYLEFFLEQQNSYNETRIKYLCEGLEILREKEIIGGSKVER